MRSARRAARRRTKKRSACGRAGASPSHCDRQEQRGALVRLAAPARTPPRPGSSRSARARTAAIGPAQVAVEAVVGEDDRCRARAPPPTMRPRAGAPVAAHLEQIGEIGLEQQGEADRHARACRSCAPRGARRHNACQMNLARTMWIVSRGRSQAAGRIEEVGIGQIDGQQRIVVLDDRAEQQRPAVVDQQLQAGQEARVLVIEPLGAALAGHDVAVVVEHAEGVAVLEGARPPLLQRRGRRDVELDDQGAQRRSRRRRLVGSIHEHRCQAAVRRFLRAALDAIAVRGRRRRRAHGTHAAARATGSSRS